MTARAWIAALALFACSPPPTVSMLVLRGEGTPELSDLTRLRLIVRTCDDDRPALAQNIPIDGQPPPKLESPIVPGTSFYVWLQGWEECNPPCAPEDPSDPQPDVCTCITGAVPLEQIFKYEACTDWLEASTDVRRTLTLAPRADPPLCPPPPLSGNACNTPKS